MNVEQNGRSLINNLSRVVIEQKKHAVQRSEQVGAKECRVWSRTKHSSSVIYVVNVLPINNLVGSLDYSDQGRRL